MYRIAIRSAARPAARNLRTTATKRFASTASPADRPRTWKGSALRWGLAGAALYYYNTSSVFADEAAPVTVAAPPTFADDELPTVDSLIEEKRKQYLQKKKTEKPTTSSSSPPASAAAAAESAAPQNPPEIKSSPDKEINEASQAVAVEEGAGALEEEAGQQGAFNPETGEINWDCPCLGGMAHGPCGEEFKTAFSCFVYSSEEPKGMDCIEKFQGMQECFRQYPEIYGAELADEEEALQEGQAEAAPTEDYQKLREDADSQKVVPVINDATTPVESHAEVHVIPAHKPTDGEVPAQWEDATKANTEEKDEPTPAKKQEEREKKE